MKALVISDSHGNIGFLKEIIATAKTVADFEQIWHLGDEYEDMDYIDFDRIIKKVPGTRHPLYYSNESARIFSFPAGQFEITLVHSPYDIPQNLVAAKRIVFYGHIHQAKIAKWGSGVLASPGHIKNSFDRGNEASFLIFEENGNSAKLSIYNKFGELKLSANIENSDENLILGI
jgi:predicted phosphodiesterase